MSKATTTTATTTTATTTPDADQIKAHAKAIRAAVKSAETGMSKVTDTLSAARVSGDFATPGDFATFVGETVTFADLSAAVTASIVVEVALTGLSGREVSKRLGVDQSRVSRAMRAAKDDLSTVTPVNPDGSERSAKAGGKGGTTAKAEHAKALEALAKVAEVLASVDLSALTLAEVEEVRDTYAGIVNGNLSRFGNQIGAALKSAPVDAAA